MTSAMTIIKTYMNVKHRVIKTYLTKEDISTRPHDIECEHDTKQNGQKSHMYPKRHDWHARLCSTHAHFCTHANCPGIPELKHIDDSESNADNTCIFALEFIWALRGILYGFRMVDHSKPIPETSVIKRHTGNSKLSTNAEAEIDKDICKEYTNGWLKLIPESLVKFCAPLFGKEEKDKVRVIKDTKANKANDFGIYFPVAMMNIRNAIPYLFSGAFMFKIDIDSAFRQVPIHSDDTKYFHYFWFGRFFRDLRTPFGARNSPGTFNRLTAIVRLIMLSLGYDILIFVDDFWGCGDLTVSSRTFATLFALLVELGLPPSEKPDKTVAPTQQLTWLGFVIRTFCNSPASITADPEKIKRLKAKLYMMTKTRSASKKELEKLVGLLVHCTTTIYGSKPFYRFLIHLINDPNYLGTMSTSQYKQFRLDAFFWLTALKKNDGKALIVDQPGIHHEFIATDACVERDRKSGKVFEAGIGGFMNGHFFTIWNTTEQGFRNDLTKSANAIQRKHKANFPFNPSNPCSGYIAYLELFAIWWMISLDPTRFQNMLIPIFIDNSNNLSWLVKETAPLGYLAILKPMQLLMLQYNIRFYPTLISSKSNVLADMASRNQIVELNNLLPNWKQYAPKSVNIRLPMHTKPGPLYLWKKGYVDPNIQIDPKLIWQDYHKEILLF